MDHDDDPVTEVASDDAEEVLVVGDDDDDGSISSDNCCNSCGWPVLFHLSLSTCYCLKVAGVDRTEIKPTDGPMM
jgi:hypothetical protein